MRAVVQRVSQASVKIKGNVKGAIESGLLVLLGVENGDTNADADYIVNKLASLRIFDDDSGKMNLSVADVCGEILLVSQFTLLGDARRGNRPGYSNAAMPEQAMPLYQYVIHELSAKVPVATGEFGADMQVELINDGPVTLLLDSHKLF